LFQGPAFAFVQLAAVAQPQIDGGVAAMVVIHAANFAPSPSSHKRR